MESPLRGNTHGGFGERPGETDREQSRHRAPGRLNHPAPRTGVAGTRAAGRKSPHNHAHAVRNLSRTLRNAAAGARLIQADGLDNKSAAELAAGLADTLAELHRLQRRLNRRLRRDQEHRPDISPDSVWPEATQA
jgi:hypothetical protein